MSKNVTIELNTEGIRELLKSMEVEDFCRQVAEERRATLGEGYETDTFQTPGRVVASIFTATDEAAADNMETNALLRAVSSS